MTTWNPHNLPIDRPYLLHIRMQDVLTGIACFTLTPEERGEKGGSIVDLNSVGLVCRSDYDKIEGFSEIPSILHETLIWRCPRRYRDSEIAQRLINHKEEEWIKETTDMMNKTKSIKFRKYCEEQLQKGYPYGFLDCFDNGKYLK